MYELITRLSALIPGVIVTCVALAAAHLGLWGSQLSRPAAYVIGSACVLLGVAVSALVLGDAWPFVVYAIHLGAGGGEGGGGEGGGGEGGVGGGGDGGGDGGGGKPTDVRHHPRTHAVESDRGRDRYKISD